MKTSSWPTGRRLPLLGGMLAAILPLSVAPSLTLKDAYQGQFYVGVAINRTIATDTPVKADNVDRTQAQVDRDIALVKRQFNQISPENDLKWALIQPRPGADGYDFAPADAYVDFGLRNHLFIVGHTLVWHNQTPDWVFAGSSPPPPGSQPANIYAGPRATRAELLQRMRDHIFTVVGRYRGKVQVWDVVNEAVANDGPDLLRQSLWLQIIGPDFIARAFQYAHEADPAAILRYNDYGLENAPKRRKFIALVKSLLAAHVPVMAIGSQTHVSVSAPSFAEEDQALTELEQLGLPIHITELDVNAAQTGQHRVGADVATNGSITQGGLVANASQRLADQYASLLRAFRRHQRVKVVTWWGVNDGVSWRAKGSPLLFDGADQAKPAFDAVIAEARR